MHELRAASDAVAVGMGTVRADNPRLDARDVGATKQPRRLAFGHGPSELEVRSGPLEDELRALAGEGVQSLLLEGGPTLATAFLRAGLVDKLLVFVAPMLVGRRAALPRRSGGAGRALAPDRERSRRGRAARGVRPRAVACSRVHRHRPRARPRRRLRGRRPPRRRGSADERRARRLGRGRRRLPDRRLPRRRSARVRRRRRDARPHDARHSLRRAIASTSSRRSARASRSAATSSRATSTASASVRGASAEPRLDRRPARGAPLLRREGLDRGRRRLAHDRRPRRGRLRGRSRAAHARTRRRSGRASPGVAVNLEVDVLAKYVERLTMGR